MFRSTTLGLAALVLLAACGDGRDSTSPIATKPVLAISDGAHSGGNGDFFFLPPIAANPSSDPRFEAGKFNGMLSPTVKVCMLDVGATMCAAAIKTFAPSDISISDQQYHVNWNTKETPLQLSRMYRISVSVGSVELGFVDVDPVSNGSQLRAVNTNEYIGLVDGKTLPIKFRIEKGATCANHNDCAEQTVTNAGATVVTDNEYAGVRFPSGWLPINEATGKPYENVVVKIERVPTGADNRCHSDVQMLQFEGCYQFTTDPYVGRFAEPVVAGVCPELSPSDPRYSQLSFFTSGPNEESSEAPEAAAPFVDCAGFTGTPEQTGALGRAGREMLALFSRAAEIVSPKSAYAIDLGVGGELFEFSRGGWVLETDIEMNGGDEQTAAPGAVLPSQISVLVTGHHGRPVRGVGIDFSTGSGSVSATGPVLTNADGVASTTWTLGSGAGSQNAFASVAGIGDGPTVTFTATAQQVIASVSLAAAQIDLGLEQSTAQIQIVQRDAAGNVIYPPGPCTWAITSNLGNLGVTQAGIVSAARPDDGVVTATCAGVVGSATVGAGDYQFVASGSVQDSFGDSPEGAPDLMGLSVSVADRRIQFTVTYEFTGVTTNTAYTTLSVDSDQQVVTGHPGISGGGTIDNDKISADYLITIENGQAQLLRYAGTLNTFTPVAMTSCATTDNATAGTRSYSCSFALSQLDYDEGYVNFKATSSTKLASGGYTGIQDVITNVGSFPGTTSPVIY